MSTAGSIRGTTAMDLREGHYTGEAAESLTGTWQFAVTLGRFLNTQIAKTVTLSGVVLRYGTMVPYVLDQREHMTMEIISVK